MKIDLKSMSRKELEKLKSDVEKALTSLKNKDRRAAQKAAEKAASQFGFTLDELTGTAKAAPAKKDGRKTPKPSKPRYANPTDPKQTWTGKGRQPNWFKEETEKGTTPEAMEIK
ncbi:H-NS histone family protein [Ascidiaceihabitans sp.]|uniref:H-NS histone family protein n=1 Tax=Ascidiaceihabitans sp. TaxID=1872644 RepID=UPI0032985958